jgi:WD40 repeat protein
MILDNNNEVCKILFSAKNNMVISGGNDNKINLFDLRKDKIIECFKHRAAIKAIALNNEENYLVSGGGTFDKKIKIWDLKKFNLISENFTDSQITNVEYLNNDTIAVSNGYISNNVNIFKLNFDIYKNDNKIVANSNTEAICNSEDIFSKISVFDKHSKRILYMGKSKCNQYLATCSTDGNLKIWKLSKFVKNKKFDEDSFFCGIR